MRKRDKLHKRWSRSGRPYDQSRFIKYKYLVRWVSDRAYEKYLGVILGLNNDQEDQNGGEPPRSKPKNFIHCSSIPSRTQAALLPSGRWPNSFLQNQQKQMP